MRRIIQNKKFVNFAIIMCIIAAIYANVLMKDPRMADGGLSFSEASLIEIIVIMQLPIYAGIFWLASIYHAFCSRKKAWFFINMFIWPMSIIYILLLNFSWNRSVNE